MPDSAEPVKLKVCNTCHEAKPLLTEFGRHGSNKGGRNGRCRSVRDPKERERSEEADLGCYGACDNSR